ncbi:MAG: aspartyl protease family protein [Acidobacteria bacterium]|nr:aspartyl protease family protein [Acidobacteriota bacterium]
MTAMLLLVMMLAAWGCRRSTYVVPWITNLGYRPAEIHAITTGVYAMPNVPVTINGRRLQLVLDTGNLSGLTLTPDWLHRLDLPVVDEVATYDSIGTETGRVPVHRAAEVAAFGRRWTDVQVLQRDTGVIDGLIGPAFLLDRRFTLDYRNRLMGISTTPLPNEAAHSHGGELVSHPGLPGLILMRGTVNGQAVLIGVDTGKSRTCIDERLVNQLDLPRTPDGCQVESVTVGPFSFDVPSAKVLSFAGLSRELPEPVLLAVGSDIMLQVILSVDYPRGRYMLTRITRR